MGRHLSPSVILQPFPNYPISYRPTSLTPIPEISVRILMSTLFFSLSVSHRGIQLDALRQREAEALRLLRRSRSTLGESDNSKIGDEQAGEVVEEESSSLLAPR